MSNLRRTRLFAIHQQLGARLVDFGGWEMPVQYSGIIDEHRAVRRAAGIFDISHMGEFRVAGPLAMDFLNYALTNDLRKIVAGQGQYTIMCNERGGTIDDLYIYCLGPHEYLLVVNASRIEADYDWLLRQRACFSDGKIVTLENESDEWGAVAVQGPVVAEFIDACFDGVGTGEKQPAKVRALKKNQIAKFALGDHLVWVARTGYTGEDGFEVIAPASAIEEVWAAVSGAGAAHGLKPAGLGARDTLRTEMGYPLYGHELDENTSPLEAGLAKFVALEKIDFVGRGGLVEQKAKGLERRGVAFRMKEKGAPPPRPGYGIWGVGVGAPRLGTVTSGTASPSLGLGIGMGYVTAGYAQKETPIEIEIRGRRLPALVVPKPIYQRSREPKG